MTTETTRPASCSPIPTQRTWLRWVCFFIWLLLLGCGYIAYDVRQFLTTPGSEEAKEIVFTIAPGATFDRVAWDLKKAGVIRDVFRFRLLAQLEKAIGGVRAGEYAVNTGWTPEQVLYQITKGQALLYRLSIREGLTWWETARAIEAQGFARYEDIKTLIHDPVFLQANGIPFANAEGFLYPETYLMKKPKTMDAASAREVVTTLVTMFWKRTEPVWTQLPVKPGGKSIDRIAAVAASSSAVPAQSTAAAATTPAAPAVASGTASSGQQLRPATPADINPADLQYLLILASLVERETPVREERPRVAGVYANRLRLGMLLQCDPTIIYGIGETFTGEIRRSQLQDASNQYNTYQHAGLPPGPICSSSAESMNAAFIPENHDYLDFVATGTGGHTFSKNLADHNKAVEVYRRTIRK